MPQDPKQPPRVLSDDESVPDWFVRDFCDDAIRRFREEIADHGRDPIQEEQARLRVVDELAGEFQHDHDYEPMAARWTAVRECAEGEQARELIAEHEREFAAGAAGEADRTTGDPEAPRVDRDQPRTRGGGER